MSKIIASSEAFEQLRAAGLLEDNPMMIRRVVLDLTAGETARLYVEHFVDERKLSAALDAGLKVERT